MEIAFRMMQKRAGWLTALFLGEMLTATAMGYFEDEIEKAVVLALFVPLIISSGGNSGSQASTLVIRALALGEVGLRDWWRVIRRELLPGWRWAASSAPSASSASRSGAASPTSTAAHWLLVAITVGARARRHRVVGHADRLAVAVPAAAPRLRPGDSSAPFVATLVDVTGLVIYFSVAMMILRGTLL